MSNFEDSLGDELEPFGKVDPQVPNLTNSNLTNEVDFAIAAWHEDGCWTLEVLSDPFDIEKIISRLKSQRTNGGAISLISIDDEFFILIRVLGTHVSFLLSDATAAFDYTVAEELLDIADIPMPDEDEEPGPVGHLEMLADLGMNGMEISALCADDELFPEEQLDAIASRLGFGQEYSELLGL